VRRRTYELWYALAAIAVITALYAVVAAQGIPRSSSVLGHCLGIVGFLMMLSTEMLYSLRKRARGKALGRMSTWLQIHIFTGIVGSYMVLLHSAWKFNGLAGALMLMTVVIVISGFIGRYIYTAVPRTVDGAEVTLRDLEHQIAAADVQLQVLGVNRLTPVLAAAPVPARSNASLVFGRALAQWKYEREVQQAIKTVDGVGKTQAVQMQQLLDERFRLQRQVQSLATARRLLAVWHTIHIPIGVALFIVAFIHIGDTLYYATFIK
jgi:malonyl CoA-acyl carrier protein transacylase